jgi:2-oxoglutarate/2-oxoacid ferredoxin oxidoreductase subunit alpha
MMQMPSESIQNASGKDSLIVNNFNITFGTVNGSGSATANTTLLRALFKMGIPVSGKNIFPSNIQGQPTWYTIRISKDGFIARQEKEDIVVAMNPASFNHDVECLEPNGVLFYADDIQIPINRTDIVVYPMPVKKISREAEIAPNLRDYIANMVYVGVIANILGIDMEKIKSALDFHFKGKEKAVLSNFSVVEKAAEWAKQNLEKKDRYIVEAMNSTKGYIMADGNTAGALGAIYGGLQFMGWYPITPATSLPEAVNEYLPKLRKDPVTGKNTYAVVQAEDELAAVGMLVGAGWAGLRAMTSTSGPGLSLMAEYLSLAYFAEVPIVIWDVQRVGPSTGLPTRTAQGDITFSYFIGHGDTQFILLFPASVNECFEFGWKAFDIAEHFQTPVLVMSDLDLGMNQWMTPEFKYPDKPMDRGKILWEKDLETFKNHWGRYLDIDGDGIPYRTVPGNRSPKSAYFGRGTGHDEFGQYSEDPEVWERVLNRIAKKFVTAKTYVPAPVIEKMKDSTIGIIGYGSSDPAIQEARVRLEKSGIKTDYLRIKAIPFAEDVHNFIVEHENNFIVEMNRDGQMKQILTINYPEEAKKLIQLSHTDGLPLTASWIVAGITSHEVKNG